MKYRFTINQLEKKGYAVCKVENFRIFKALQDSFIKNINFSNSKKKTIEDVRKYFAKMNKAEINKF